MLGSPVRDNELKYHRTNFQGYLRIFRRSVHEQRYKIICFILSIFLIYLFILFFHNPVALNTLNFDLVPTREEFDHLFEGNNKAKLLEYIKYGGNYIMNSQKSDGSFIYTYYPSTNTYAHGNNILRHSGTTYAILSIYDRVREVKYLETGERGLLFIKKYLYKLDDDKMYVKYNRRVKLGGAALALLSFCKFKEVTGEVKYDHIMEGLANFILFLQKESGEFVCYYKEEGKTSVIYPGEAMLALIKYYNLEEKEKYFQGIEKAYSFYSAKSYNFKRSAFIPWSTSACYEVFKKKGIRKYADFAFEMTDYAQSLQIKSSRQDSKGYEVKGGFGSQPQINTASYCEGIGDAYKLALLVDDANRITKYRDTLTYAVEWITSLQFRKDEIIQKEFKEPKAAFGAFHLYRSGSKYDEIRIDYVQHSCSALLRVVDSFSDEDFKRIEYRN